MNLLKVIIGIIILATIFSPVGDEVAKNATLVSILLAIVILTVAIKLYNKKR